MSPRHAVRERRRAARHARAERRHPFLGAIALGLVAALAFGAAGMATALGRFQGNIDSADVDHLLGERPDAPTPDPDDPNAGTPVNILIMGSDSREGNQSIAADDVDGQRSDTTIVAHISADRKRVEMVSIPRDSLVDIPECLRSDGSVGPAEYNAMFNSAFQKGGANGDVADAAACAVKTVEATTGVYIHHFVVVDMNGFINMIDAIGGVPMCIPHDMYSDKARLALKAGKRHLDGKTALAFARARTGQGLGDGSDTGRIGRQQELLASTAREVLSKNLLTDVPQLVRFLDAATRSLTVSSGLSNIQDMAGLAYSLRSTPGKGITFMTIPFVDSTSQRGRVEWSAEADAVWAAMKEDTPIGGEDEEEAADDAGSGGSGGSSNGTSDDGAGGESAGGGSGDESDEPATKTPGKEQFSVDDLTPTACR